MSGIWERVIEPSKSPISSKEVADFEAHIGFSLPNDYREFLLEFNGGKITVEHEIHVPEISGDTFIYSLLSLTRPSPSLGIKEALDIAEKNNFALKQAIQIGDNMGTGFHFIVLDGPETGAVYFAWKEDVFDFKNSPLNPISGLPISLAKLSPDFDSLAEIILTNSTWSDLD